MMVKPLIEDPGDGGIEVGSPKKVAVGIPAIEHAMEPALRNMGVVRTAKLLTSMNQKDGFDCMSCAWPDPPEHRKTAEFCENGAKAVTWEATPLTIPSSFWAEHSLTELAGRSEFWLGQQGRLVEPVYKAPGSDHYAPIGWNEAFGLIAEHVHTLPGPDAACFYTSGRASNEAAFIYQLFARALGTNNLPDCSNMCHESSGTALSETIGIGKATVSYDDYAKADLIIVMGQNPGTNHPRMLTALEDAKKNGAQLIAINPLPEAGLIRYRNPQTPRGLLGKGTALADLFLQVRLGGDLALLQAVSARVLAAEAAAPGTVLDHEFIDRYTDGFDEMVAALGALNEADVLEATGLTTAQIDDFAARYINAERVIVTWAMGITQHKQAVDAIREIVNLLLLRGNIGRPGAGVSPIRGHSNVQGDRTMGVWEQMPDSFHDALDAEFGFASPRRHGYDAVKSVEAMQRGDIGFWMSLGGNFVSAISDTAAAEAGLRGVGMTVQVSTKLNRSHAVTGDAALILPTLGRTEIDRQSSGEQFVTVEDTVCAVHPSHGRIEPVASGLRSEVAIISGVARAVLAGREDLTGIDWTGFADDYDTIRRHISAVVPGCDDYQAKVSSPGGFVLPNGPRDSRTFPTATGKARFTANTLEVIRVPEGRLLLQTVRSHDQFNTTIYGRNDRYRGIKSGRMVVFVNPDDLAARGLADGDMVDIVSEWPGDEDRVLRGMRCVAYPTAPGCVAAYFPEANVLVPLSHTARRSNTPASKAVVVRLEKA